MPAKAKLGMMAELDRLAIEKASRRQARLQIMKQYGVSETFCWNLQRSATESQPVRRQSCDRQHGCETARQPLGPGPHGQSAGKRVPEEGQALGRPDHLKSVWQETRAWALSEEARQHILTAGDVLVDFEDRLEAAIAVRQAEETAGTLDKTGQVELAAMRQKRDSLTNNKRQRDKYQVKLLAKCGLRSRACQQTANLSQEKEKEPGGFGTSYSSTQLAPSQTKACQWQTQRSGPGTDRRQSSQCQTRYRPGSSQAQER